MSSKSNPVKVPISYSHDSPEHRDRVLALSNRLRAEGVDCHIDQYEESPREGWPRWMRNQIENAAFVLVICTEKYQRRFQGQEEAGKGLGAKWEGAIITQELYEAEANSNKFIPVVFSSRDSAYIPAVLRGMTRYELDTEEGYEKLYRRLTGQPSVLKPELGKPRSMPPLQRRQDFLDITEDRREPLPYSDVVVGTFKADALAVEIRAQILLDEKIQPATEIFLDRISLGQPYCPICSRSLDSWDADWTADGIQIGYQCPSCETQREGAHHDLLKDVHGEVRRNYREYWQHYQKAIQDLTRGNPHKFKVP